MQPSYKDLRFYCFTNFYLSSIQHGIQTGHASVDLVRKYQKKVESVLRETLTHSTAHKLATAKDDLVLVEDWADNHKTYITLNGGDDEGLKKALELVATTDYPFVEFIEPGLGGVRTAVGVILPDSIFDMRREMQTNEWEATPFPTYVHKETGNTIYPHHKLFPFMEYFKSCGLAR